MANDSSSGWSTGKRNKLTPTVAHSKKLLNSRTWVSLHEPDDKGKPASCMVACEELDGPDTMPLTTAIRYYPQHIGHEALCQKAEKLYKDWLSNLGKTVLEHTVLAHAAEQEQDLKAVPDWKIENVTDTASSYTLRIGDKHLLRLVIYHPGTAADRCLTVTIMELREGGYNAGDATWRITGDHDTPTAKRIAIALASNWFAVKSIEAAKDLCSVISSEASLFAANAFYVSAEDNSAQKIDGMISLANEIGAPATTR